MNREKKEKRSNPQQIAVAIVIAIVGLVAGIILAWPSMKDPTRISLLLWGVGLFALSSVSEFIIIAVMLQRLHAERRYQDGLQHGVQSRIVKESIPFYDNGNGINSNGFPTIPYPQTPQNMNGNNTRQWTMVGENLA